MATVVVGRPETEHDVAEGSPPSTPEYTLEGPDSNLASEQETLESSYSVSRDTATVIIPDSRIRAFLWNIQDLGGGPSRGSERKSHVMDAIAFMITRANADFIALLEVKKTGPKYSEPKRPVPIPGLRGNSIETFMPPESIYLRGVKYRDLRNEMLNGIRQLVPEFTYQYVNTAIWLPLMPDDNAEDRELAESGKAPVKLDSDDPITDALQQCEDAPKWSADAKLYPDVKDALLLAVDTSRKLEDLSWLVPDEGDEEDLTGILDDAPWPPPADALKSMRELAAKLAELEATEWSPPTAELPKEWVTATGLQTTGLPSSRTLGDIALLREQTTFVNQGLRNLLKGVPEEAKKKGGSPKKETKKKSGSPEKDPEEVKKTIDKVLKEVEQFDLQLDLVEQVNRDIFVPLLRRVFYCLHRAGKLASKEFANRANERTGTLFKELLNYSHQARSTRYEQVLKTWQKRRDESANRGSMPGLTEFYEIVKRVNKNNEYNVWPPLAILQAAVADAQEEKKNKDEGKKVELDKSQYKAYFTNNEESYGILYRRSMFEAYGDREECKDIPAICEAKGFIKRAPFVVPLRVKRLRTIIHFLPWHAPAPTSTNVGTRASDFPQFTELAKEYRKIGEIAVLLSDTNIDTSVKELNNPIEHCSSWKGGKAVPTRSAIMDEWTGRTGTLDHLGVGTLPTSMVKTKIVPNGTFYYAHKAAYDKIMIISNKATIKPGSNQPASLLLQAQQQLASVNRAMQYKTLRNADAEEDVTMHETEPGKEEQAESGEAEQSKPKLQRRGSIIRLDLPAYAPSSPLVSYSGQMDPEIVALVRTHKPDKLPGRYEETMQLVEDAHKLSDHEAVISDMILVTLPEGHDTYESVIEKYRTELSGESAAKPELIKLLQHVEAARYNDAQLGELMNSYVFDGNAKTYKLSEEPSTTNLEQEQWKASKHLASKTSSMLDVSTIQTVQNQFAAQGLHAVSNPGGGACLFYSLCELRYGDGKNVNAAYGMRFKAVAHLHSIVLAGTSDLLDRLNGLYKWHKEAWPTSPVYAGSQPDPWTNYIAEMSKPNTWGDLIMLLVVSDMLSQRYQIFVQLGAAAWIDIADAAGNEDAEQDSLFCDNAFHWEAVVGDERAESVEEETEEDWIQPEGEESSSDNTRIATGPTSSFAPAFAYDRFLVCWDADNGKVPDDKSREYYWDGKKIADWGLESWLFVFGDNNDRKRYGGQANIRDHTSYAVGLRTCENPATNRLGEGDIKHCLGLSEADRETWAIANGFGFAFRDSELLTKTQAWIDEDVETILQKARTGQYARVVLPFSPGRGSVPGRWNLGTDLAAMPVLAPKTFAYLQQKVSELATVLDAMPIPQAAFSTSAYSGNNGQESEETVPMEESTFVVDQYGSFALEPGQGAFRRSFTSPATFQVQLVSMLGPGSGAPGFHHPDVTAVLQNTETSVQVPVNSVPRWIAPLLEQRVQASELRDFQESFDAGVRTIEQRRQKRSLSFEQYVPIDGHLDDEGFLNAPRNKKLKGELRDFVGEQEQDVREQDTIDQS